MSSLTFDIHTDEWRKSKPKSNPHIQRVSEKKPNACPYKEKMESLPLDLVALAVQTLLAVLVHPVYNSNIGSKC